MIADPLKPAPFTVTSRYYGIETANSETQTGKTIVYLKRRFLPQPEKFSVLTEHTVKEGDRLDNIAAQYLGDPEQFWRICDANRAMSPNQLTATLGSQILITLPEGITGYQNA
ncbi:LysM peptidoglycan-binding domain-containing protein [Nostoc sp. UHCC 0702]|nr:LysM peptidoglycan-binding domain-containing protein [Nostoc sp. UHCC 0702]